MINVLGGLMGSDLTIKRARQSGIEVDDNGTLLRFGDNGEEAAVNYLHQFTALSGDMAVNYLINHLDNVFVDYPELKEFLQQQKG